MTGQFAAYDADTLQEAVELQPRHADHGAADELQRQRAKRSTSRWLAGGAGDMRGARLYRPCSRRIAVFGFVERCGPRVEPSAFASSTRAMAPSGDASSRN